MKVLKIYLVFMVLVSMGCAKSFLDEKPDKALVVPSNLEDMKALLDNNGVMNVTSYYTIMSGDELVSSNKTLEGLILNSYTWADKIWTSSLSSDWNKPFEQIFYANVVLDGLKKNKESLEKESGYREIKGAALFFRSIAYFWLLQQFAKPYLKSTAANELGMPIRLTADVNKKYSRSTLEETYKQIINDLEVASELLPLTSSPKTRPSKLAAYALLARTMLSMNDFEMADFYAGKCLAINDDLLDYNSLNANLARPFPNPLTIGNPEVIFYNKSSSSGFYQDGTTSVVREIYDSYQAEDLRKAMFYTLNNNGNINFKGSYSGGSPPFSGLTNGEVYLIKAESSIRLNKLEEGLGYFNALLKKRYAKNEFDPYPVSNQAALLQLVLAERKKEMVYRGLRWMDLRRLNAYDHANIDVIREFNGVTHVLKANSPRFVFPIPDYEINLSGLIQNER